MQRASNGAAGSSFRKQRRRNGSIAGDTDISFSSILTGGAATEDACDESATSTAVPDDLVEQINLKQFSNDEKFALDNLLQRVQTVQAMDDKHKDRLRENLQSALSQASSVQDSIHIGVFYRMCELCGCKLYPLNRKYICQRCENLACSACIHLTQGRPPQCRLCHLEFLTEAQSGEWFLTEVRRRSERAFFGPDVLRASLRRERRRLVLEEKARRTLEAQQQAAAIQAATAARTSAPVTDSTDGSKPTKPAELVALELPADKKTAGKKQSPADRKKAEKEKKMKEKKGQKDRWQSQALVVEEAPTPPPPPPPLPPPQQPIQEVIEEPPTTVVALETQVAVTAAVEEQSAESLVEEEPVDEALIQPEGPAVRAAAAPVEEQTDLDDTDHATTADEEPAAVAGPSPGTNLVVMDATSRESVVSNVSETEDSYRRVLASGEVEVTVRLSNSQLIIIVHQCYNLARIDSRQPNPYVKTYLLPDKTKRSKRRTHARRGTCNPTYGDQPLSYLELTEDELAMRTLQISVWHSTSIGANMFMGEARLTMEQCRSSGSGRRRLKLGERQADWLGVSLPTLMYRGDLVLSIRFELGDGGTESAAVAETRTGRLEVWLKSCSKLGVTPVMGMSTTTLDVSPYVKSYLLPDQRKSKRKSKVVKSNPNPEFNSMLAYNGVTIKELKERSLELTVWDHVRLGKNDFLGGVRLNLGDNTRYPWMDARGHEQTLWSGMLRNPNKWIDGSLILRPNMDPLVTHIG